MDGYKRMGWIACLLLACLAACAPAAPEEAAIKTETERLIERALEPETTPAETQEEAQPDESGHSAREALMNRLGIPETWQFHWTNADEGGVVSIDADVPVTLPDAEHLPVIRVTRGGFSQEQARRLFAACCGDTTMYTHFDVVSKAQYQAQLLELDRIMAYAPWHREMRQGQAEAIRAALADAPETANGELCDGTYKTGPIETYDIPNAPTGTVRSVSAMELPGGYGKQFSVRDVSQFDSDSVGRIEHADGVVEYAVPTRKAGCRYEAHVRLMRYFPNQLLEYVTAESAAEGAAHPSCVLATTPYQARRLAEAFLKDAGMTGFIVDRVALNRYENPQVPEDVERQCYAIRCVRTVGNIPVSSADGFSTRVVEGAYADQWDYPGIEWYYERVELLIDDSGILFFQWDEPLAIGETVTDSAALLPFSDIGEIVSQTLAYQYGNGEHPETTTSYRVTVTGLTLSLQRVCDYDSWKSGLLVPVWNVYCRIEETRTDGDGETIVWSDAHPVLSVQAIDGSVIDLQKGY